MMDLIAADNREGIGRSKSALRRREKRTRGITHQGQPDEVISMSRGRQYVVAPDGSFRRIKIGPPKAA